MAGASERAAAMPVVPALQVLVERRLPEQIVVTNQGSARVWPQLSREALESWRPLVSQQTVESRQLLDLHYNPSTMGGAIPLALGLALAQPRREVLVISGDGSLLMSLGSLVTVIGARVVNLTIVVLENDLYEVTGGQKTPAAGTPLDFAALAKAAGFATARRYSELEVWRAGALEMYSVPGPRFVSLVVGPTPAELLKGATPPLFEQMAALRAGLELAPPAGGMVQSFVTDGRGASA
jgi:sulfopyruvate decarboxylase subunit beta